MRSNIANALTYTTQRRSADFVFTVASGRSDLDPDTEVFTRRAVLCRRVIGGDKQTKKMADEIMDAYRERTGTGMPP